jgi:phosphatidylserine decarboxylase
MFLKEQEMTSDIEIEKACYKIMTEFDKDSIESIKGMEYSLNEYLKGIKDRKCQCLIYMDKRTRLPKLDVFDSEVRLKFIEGKLTELRKEAGKNASLIYEYEKFRDMINGKL